MGLYVLALYLGTHLRYEGNFLAGIVLRTKLDHFYQEFDLSESFLAELMVTGTCILRLFVASCGHNFANNHLIIAPPGEKRPP